MTRTSAPPPEEATGPAHQYRLFGHGAALARMARAIRSGRPPQALLISGPPGIGKATFAYRLARYLLRYGTTDAGPSDLTVPADDSVSRRIEAGSHPGLLVLERGIDDRGRLRSVLGVNEVRRLGQFFGMTETGGGWRVAIVDSADDMNDAAANALLKVLEEPPPRAVLIVLSHAPGRLLPTIRSRCQRLALRPLDAQTMAAALGDILPDLTDAERMALAELSGGSPGLAVRLGEEDGLALARDAKELVTALGPPDVPALISLAERVACTSDGLAHFGAFLSAALIQQIRARAAREEPGLGRWVDLYEKLDADFGRAIGLHLEPKQTTFGSALAVRETVRHGRA